MEQLRLFEEDPAQSGLFIIEEMVRPRNLIEAYRRVKRNGGAPGVDGMTVHELGAYLRSQLESIREQMLTGTYRPKPVRRVEIPKPGGGVRKLGVPTALDRLLQQALLQVLNPIFDPGFSTWSFGFRPGRGTHDAVRQAKAHVEAGYNWVVDLDLEKFFDRVNHDLLMARVARKVKDKVALRLIRAYLEAGVLADGLVSPIIEGTPQGGPLSPLLSNILLDDLDKELERRHHRFCRYADDCNVYVRSRRAGERLKASITQFLSSKLRLQVNETKSAVDRPWERQFLGYSMLSTKGFIMLRVAPDREKRMRKGLRPLFSAARGRAISDTLATLAPKIRGWASYFQLSHDTKAFVRLDKWTRRRIRAILWRQWKTPRTRYRELIKRGLHPNQACSAYSNRGPWRMSATPVMQMAVPNKTLTALGLVSFLEELRRLKRSAG